MIRFRSWEWLHQSSSEWWLVTASTLRCPTASLKQVCGATYSKSQSWAVSSPVGLWIGPQQNCLLSVLEYLKLRSPQVAILQPPKCTSTFGWPLIRLGAESVNLARATTRPYGYCLELQAWF